MEKKKKPFVNVDPVASVMKIEKGEEIVGAWITPEIPEVGFYKLLAKKKVDGTCEWAHFVERATGAKESFFTGKTKDENELAKVVEIVNNNLGRIFGPRVQLHEAVMVTRSVDDAKLGNEKNN